MKKNGFLLTLICCLVIAASIGAAALLARVSPPSQSVDVPVSGSSKPDTTSNPGDLEAIDGVNHQEVVEKGRLPGYEEANINTDQNAFLYLFNREIFFDKPTATGNIMMENTPGNTCTMQAEFSLADSGKIIYTSAKLEPGEFIQKDRLDVKLAKGTYEVNAAIHVYNFEGGLVETYTESVTITVNNKLF